MTTYYTVYKYVCYNLWTHQKERHVKKDLKYYKYKIDRGKEWVQIHHNDLKPFIVDSIENRNRIRNEDSKRIRTTDRIIKIINHRKKSNNHLEYLVQLNRSAEDRQRKLNYKTWETLRKIQSYPATTKGLQLLNQYRRRHSINSKS